MSRLDIRLRIGVEVQPDGSTHFRVWAPDPRDVGLVVQRCTGATDDVELTKEEDGYYSARVPDIGAGGRYWFRLDGELTPDPASRFQPEGVFGPSQIVDPGKYRWRDAAWRGITPERRVTYEMHVGTFTPQGTWCAAMEKLAVLADTGIT